MDCEAVLRCVSFDFDHTLAFVTPLTFHLIPKLFKERGINVNVDDFIAKGRNLRNYLSKDLQESYNFFGTLSKEERLMFIKRYHQARIELIDFPDTCEMIQEVKEWVLEQVLFQQKKQLFPDVVPTIKKLYQKNLKLYVLSGNHSDGIIELLEEGNILDYFDELITVDRYSQSKVENFNVLLDKTQFSPEEILHVGDDLITDGFGPNQFGIKSVIISRPELAVFQEEKKHTFPIISELEDLFKFIS